MAAAETVRQLALPFAPPLSSWTDMHVWWCARTLGWDPSIWCRPPGAVLLAEGWRDDAERWILSVGADAGSRRGAL